MRLPALALILLAVPLAACGGSDDGGDAPATPQKLAVFEGSYQLVSAMETEATCDGTAKDVAADTDKYYLLYARSVFGNSALFIDSCKTPEECVAQDLPLFVPSVSTGELPKLSGQWIDASSYAETKSTCLLTSHDVTLERLDDTHAAFVTTRWSGELPVASKDECKPALGREHRDQMKCASVRDVRLERR